MYHLKYSLGSCHHYPLSIEYQSKSSDFYNHNFLWQGFRSSLSTKKLKSYPTAILESKWNKPLLEGNLCVLKFILLYFPAFWRDRFFSKQIQFFIFHIFPGNRKCQHFPDFSQFLFSVQIFPGNCCTPDSPRPLYEVNFLGTISSKFLDFSDYFWVEDHLLQTYFNFQYPRFTQNVPVKRNQVTKNCTSDLFILR